MDTDSRFYIGIEVGAGRVSAGIFDQTGRMLAIGSQEFRSWQSAPDFIGQSAGEIWRSCGVAVRKALADAGLPACKIRGAGIAAPGSLVALNANSASVTLSPKGEDEQNVIAWNDHRSTEQAGQITNTNSAALKYVDGQLTSENQASKLLWIKDKLPNSWKRTARFYDLADYLSWKATGQDVRSLSSTVRNWLYLGHEKGTTAGSIGRWNEAFLEQSGLGDLRDDQHQRIGRVIRPAGEALGTGLSESGARELGLKAGIPTGVSINQVHAGGIGVLGCIVNGKAPTPDVLNTRVAIVGGASSYHLAVSREPRFIPGINGPYYSSMIPGLWTNEAEQTATGSMIDNVIYSHPAATQVRQQARKTGGEVYDLLNLRLDDLSKDAGHPALLARDVHILPYFDGRRSPQQNASLRGAITGLGLKAGVDELAVQYLAAVQATAYGARHIIDTFNANGYAIETVFLSGFGVKNDLFVREHADSLGRVVVLPGESDSGLLGAAILGAVAAGDSKTVLGGMATLNTHGDIVEPTNGAVKRYHDAKYSVFKRMHEDFLAYRGIMNGMAAG